MSILVTGVSGLIGSNVARMLVEEDKKVIGFDVASPGPHTVIAGMAEKIPFIYGNVFDLALLLNVVKWHKVEGIIHTAALHTFDVDSQPLEGTRINIEGTLNVLEAARIFNLKRVVCCSSASVTGVQQDRPMESNMKESDLDLPYGSMYPISKLTNELHVHVYREKFGVSAIICRPARVWGPGFNRWEGALPIATMIRDAVEGRPIKLDSGGNTGFDFTYVRDVARGLIQALEVNTTKSCVFNLSSGRLFTLSQIADFLRKEFPDLPIEIGSGKMARILTSGYHIATKPAFDITRAREELGYDPQYGLKKGIPAYIAWIKEGKYI
ncbi:NAD-dependent epimerase/dehydratase family protein [Chloroflexota bacterium]